jgi:hypothetical protein
MSTFSPYSVQNFCSFWLNVRYKVLNESQCCNAEILVDCGALELQIFQRTFLSLTARRDMGLKS